MTLPEINITLEKETGVKFISKFTESLRNDAVRELLTELANEFIKTIGFVAPRKTGEYATSWKISQIDSKKVTISTPHGDLALYLEYGTAPHPITPKDKFALRWVDGSGVHFALYVRHPGFPAKPHIRPTGNVIQAKFPEFAANIINKYNVKQA